MCRKALYPEISSRCSLFLRTSAACSSCKNSREDTRWSVLKASRGLWVSNESYRLTVSAPACSIFLLSRIHDLYPEDRGIHLQEAKHCRAEVEQYQPAAALQMREWHGAVPGEGQAEC